MPNTKKVNKIKELKINLNNTMKNYNIVKMKIKVMLKEEKLEMMKEVL